MYRVLRSAVLVSCLTVSAAQAAGDPEATIRSAEQVLAEIMSMPGKRIPEALIAEAQGVAIIPNVVKIGFVAGARRGHGVVLVRDAEGEWSLPQFLTLTGGSVGWQAGIQGTDVVLVFTTKKGVDGLMQGKFTIGGDASVSAGPVGRNAAAATDATLKSEILSYSRSRGLFLGVSIDGSALEIDHESHFLYYGSQSSELPRRLPESASRLRQELVNLTGVHPPFVIGSEPGVPSAPAKLDVIRSALGRDARQLYGILDPVWQKYLALPAAVFERGDHPTVEAMNAVLKRYDLISTAADYRGLAQRPEFQSTFEILHAYTNELAAAWPPALKLPPPPLGMK